MARANDAALADVEILGQGHALRWPRLDADFTVPGLLMGVFGTRAWMASELARHAGRAKSSAKAAAARANGRKGGRPRRKAA
jgi:succinylarginine dihydrolase